jgi:hypothetical protein
MLHSYKERQDLVQCGQAFGNSIVERKNNHCMQNLLTWFADFPKGYLQPFNTTTTTTTTTASSSPYTASSSSSNDIIIDGGEACWYSLHNMVAAGMARYETFPGEWFGPNTACYIVRDLVKCHYLDWCHENDVDDDTFDDGSNGNRTSGESGNGNSNGIKHKSDIDTQSLSQPPFQVYVASEACIYLDEIEELMTRQSNNNNNSSDNNNKSACNESDNTDLSSNDDTNTFQNDNDNNTPLSNDSSSTTFLHPLSDTFLPTNTSSKATTASQPKLPPPKPKPWNTSLLILIPLRLGLTTFQSNAIIIF